jgi:hypothetical protein
LYRRHAVILFDPANGNANRSGWWIVVKFIDGIELNCVQLGIEEATLWMFCAMRLVVFAYSKLVSMRLAKALCHVITHGLVHNDDIWARATAVSEVTTLTICGAIDELGPSANREPMWVRTTHDTTIVEEAYVLLAMHLARPLEAAKRMTRLPM